MRALLVVAVLLAGAAAAGELEPDAGAPAATVSAAEVTAPPAEPMPGSLRGGCVSPSSFGLPEGPISLGHADADLATGRRACPRNELGLAVRGLPIIDTPNFYGNISAQAVLFGSWAVRPGTELFASLEALSVGFTQNATLTKTAFTLGHLTAGATQVVYDTSKLTGAMTGRVLLPTSFEIPGMRLVGAELGHTVSYRALSWLEVHGAATIELTAGLGAARSDPRIGALGTVGAMWQPNDWFGLVVDVAGRAGRVSYLAPAIAARFKVSSLGIEVGVSRALVGNDRHLLVGGLRLSWRL